MNKEWSEGLHGAMGFRLRLEGSNVVVEGKKNLQGATSSAGGAKSRAIKRKCDMKFSQTKENSCKVKKKASA